MSKQTEFINKIVPGSLKNMVDYGILASITIAQAILESGWGESILASKHKNLFGIKADKSWHGKVCTMRTAEYKRNNEKYYVEADFREYDSFEESIHDHALFLVNNPRYKESGFFEEDNYKGQANALLKAGYATSPEYSNTLIQLIESYNLFEYDRIVNENSNTKYNINFCLAFQKWYNGFTNRKLVEDGIYGPNTEKAYLEIGSIIKDFK